MAFPDNNGVPRQARMVLLGYLRVITKNVKPRTACKFVTAARLMDEVHASVRTRASAHTNLSSPELAVHQGYIYQHNVVLCIVVHLGPYTEGRSATTSLGKSTAGHLALFILKDVHAHTAHTMQSFRCFLSHLIGLFECLRAPPLRHCCAAHTVGFASKK